MKRKNIVTDYALNIPIFIEEKQNQKTNRIQIITQCVRGLLENAHNGTQPRLQVCLGHLAIKI